MKFSIAKIINCTGLILTIVGAYVIYKYSPINVSVIDGGTANTIFDPSVEIMKNNFMRGGVFTVLFGTALQLLSNFIPEKYALNIQKYNAQQKNQPDGK